MPRKKTPRSISSHPRISFFKPQGVCLKNLEIITLYEDEFEAIKLYDIDELSQIQAAKKMNISQPTFGRIVHAAYKKMSTALYKGKAIAIQTPQESTYPKYSCENCGKNCTEENTV